jgi:hypothetical protein
VTTNLSRLAAITSVEDDYAHYPKEVVALPDSDVVLPDGHLKWYEVRKAEAIIDDGLRSDALEFLRAEAASGALAISGELGFVIHHLCGETFYFLIVCTWRNNNEMWETIYYQDLKDDSPLQRLEPGRHRETMCVWEMGALVHEQQAWIRYLYSARDEQAKQAYLDDRFTGSV